MFLLALLVGCADMVAPASDTADAAGDYDSALEVRSGAVATGVELRWNAPATGSAWIELEDADGTLHVLDGSVDGDQLLGVVLGPPDSELWVAVVYDDGSGPVEVEATGVTFDAPEVELQLPEVRRVEDGAQVPEGRLLYTYYTASAAYAVLAAGDVPLWYAPLAESLSNQGGIPAEFALDGDGVLVQRQLMVHDGHSGLEAMADNVLRRISWTGEETEVWPTPSSHHLIDQPEPGTVLYLRADQRESAGLGQQVVFEQVVELDLASGAERVLFDTEVLGIDKDCEGPSYYGDACDPFHANSVDCHPETGICALSLATAGTVVLFDRGTGDLVADLAAFDVQFLDPDQSQAFESAHDVRWTGSDSIQVFNDGNEGAWATELTIDLDAQKLTEAWSYGLGGCVRAQAQGGLQQLDDGHHLLNYGAPSSLLREVDASGEVVWEATIGELHEDVCGDIGLSTVLGQGRLVAEDTVPDGLVILPASAL